ncbi:imidazolonepropionase [Halocatena halophila]|uniref:imidazolonepropionase n=1 Tax=Halocatena halophila TaxID=2814576 RepID=UPI002ED549D4
MIDLLIHDAAELLTGPTDGTLKPIEDGAVAIDDGTIVAAGKNEAVTEAYPPASATQTIDASGQTLAPGFVDSHTHALFGGDRSDEFAAKLEGTSYQEIADDGGGILRTVRATRSASDDVLLDRLRATLDTMVAHGTTTVEIKSGYGLDVETELRMLSLIERAGETHPVDVIPTFMGAHAVPEDESTSTYVDQVVTEQLPAVEAQGIAQFCDVFCEDGVFDVAQSRRILSAGIDHGLTPKIHAEEFVHLGGAALAAEIGATSADHLLKATDDDRTALIEAAVTPVLLPGTAFTLDAAYADARAFLDAGGSVALATDFNPNCHSPSMPMTVALGCVGMRMTPLESMTAATVWGARALDLTETGVGTIQQGAPADLVVLDGPTHVHVPYSFGVNPVATVVKDGAVVVQ